MAAPTWQTTFSEECQNSLYEIYLVLFNAIGLTARSKQRAFEAAADGPHSWSVVQITESALIQMCNSGTCDGLRRAHRVKRADRAAQIFGCEQPMKRTDLFEHFFGLDEVVLSTPAENGKHGDRHWSTVIDIPPQYFTKSGMKAVASPTDLDWAYVVAKSRGLSVQPRKGPERKLRARRDVARSLA
jgi:hypothetical protein